MDRAYQARWISKARLDEVRKKRMLGSAIVLDHYNGFLIVEPVGAELGDGIALSAPEADYELVPIWCTGPKATLREARHRLGLDVGAARKEMAGSVG
jgi:hypothetical protein